jgi:hypothetical protein
LPWIIAWLTLPNLPNRKNIKIVVTQLKKEGKSCAEQNKHGSILFESVLVWFSKFHIFVYGKRSQQLLLTKGSKDEWHVKFLVEPKHSRVKDVLLGKILIPKSFEVFDVKADKDKQMLWVIEMNELAIKQLVLSINVSSSSGKTVFGIVKRCETKDYEGG